MQEFKDKDILVTGGCGSIGSEIVRQLSLAEPKRIRVFDHDEKGHFTLGREIKTPAIRHLIGDIRDDKRLVRAMDGVDIVFHAAALKHVPFCEYNPYEAVYTNVSGTKNVIDAAIACNVSKLIAISTDKAVNPINTMGATKLLSERLVINAPVGTSEIKLSCVRFGNVLASSGSVIPIFLEQIKKGGPITLTSPDMTRFFMTVTQAVNLIFEGFREMDGRDIFILKMPSLKISDLAEVMIDLYAENPTKIGIDTTGIRPGEKLYEELFTEEEMPFITEKEKVFVLRNSPFDRRAIYRPENHFQNSSTTNLLGKEEIRKILSDLSLA